MNKFYERIAPVPLFACTLLCLPALVFQQNVLFLWIDVLLFAVLAGFKKGRFRILPPLIILISIVFFNILSPIGRVLFTIGTFRITEGALLMALEKSGVLLGMVFLSQYAVSRNLRLPGKFGGFLSHTFLFFDRLSAEKTAFQIKAPFESIDERLFAVYTQKDANDEDVSKIHEKAVTYSPFSWIICLLPLFTVYTLLFATQFFLVRV